MRNAFMIALLALGLAAFGCGGGGGTDAGPGGDAGDGGQCAAEGDNCTATTCCTDLTCNTATMKCEKKITPPKPPGAPCKVNDECQSGLCYTDSGRITQGYCSTACQASTECAIPGKTSCCNNSICEIVAGKCGAGTGVMGDNCSAGGSSDCAAGLMCVGARGGDGTFKEDAVCSKACAADTDCHDLCDAATKTCTITGGQCAVDSDCPKNRPNSCLTCFSASYAQKMCQVTPQCTISCDKDADCNTANGEQCGLDIHVNPDNSEVVKFGCMKNCYQGSKKYGEACTKDDECCSLFCMKGECVGACATDADCGDANHLCSALTLGLSQTDQCLTTTLHMCERFEGSKDPCEATSECKNEEYCQYIPDNKGEPRSICGTAPADGLEGGETCGSGVAKQCKGGFCSSLGYCLDTCITDADCSTKGGKMVCAFEQMSDRVGKGLCLRADGSQTNCTKDTDCAAGEACKSYPIPGGSISLCVTGTKDGKAMGDKCSSTIPCLNDLCLTAGYCSGSCAADADCPPVGGGNTWHCSSMYLGCDSNANACVALPGSNKVCAKDADCDAGERCKLLPKPNGGGYALFCTTESKNGTADGAVPGSRCTRNSCDPNPSDCANDMCYFYGVDSYICSAACATDADCPTTAGLGWTCEDLGDGNKLCFPTVGSGTACMRDADCAATNEACFARICGKPLTNGADPGSPVGGDCMVCNNPCDQTCVDKACYNNMCNSRTWTCSRSCQANADCGAKEFACVIFPDSGNVGQCNLTAEILTISCTADADCMNPAENFCVDPGNGIKHCGVKCTQGQADSCPANYDCKEIMDGTTSKGWDCVLHT